MTFSSEAPAPRIQPGQPCSIDGNCYLLYDAIAGLEPYLDCAQELSIVATHWSDRDTLPDSARVLLYLNDEQIRDLTPLTLDRHWEIGVLPHPEGTHAAEAYGAKGEPPALMRHYLEIEAVEADAVTCNGELMFSTVVIGRVLTLRPHDINRAQTRFSFFSGALKGVKQLRLRTFKVTTAKERSISLAAIGLLLLNHTRSALIGSDFSDDLFIADGHLSLVALAPRSKFGYLQLLLRALIPGKFSLNRLPESVALIQTDRIMLEAPRGCEYLIDGKPVHANEIECRVLERRLRLLPGPLLRPDDKQASVPMKETVRLNHVPVNDTARALSGKSLPLFSHASEQEYRELFLSLRESSAVSSSYRVLMVLSVLLSLVGLYADSPPVIIGAMILAPLMSPVISLAMGMARSDADLIRNSLQTLAVGMTLGLGCALLLAWLMPLDVPSAQMRARMSPNLLDLMIAVISGVAGAYAYAKEEVAKSLAGVAIAVALVPPLSVAGIGLGWGEWHMAWGAFLLLVTNLVGISLSASLTFLAMGFAPFERAKKGVGITLLMLLVIAVPLSMAFMRLVEANGVITLIPDNKIVLHGAMVEIGQPQVQLGEPLRIRVLLTSDTQLSSAHVDALKVILSERLGRPIEIEAQFSIRR